VLLIIITSSKTYSFGHQDLLIQGAEVTGLCS